MEDCLSSPEEEKPHFLVTPYSSHPFQTNVLQQHKMLLDQGARMGIDVPHAHTISKMWVSLAIISNVYVD